MEPLTRINYRDSATGQPRTQTTLRRESLVDFENYLRPWERAHGSALHTPGIAVGLQVRATSGATGFKLLPGVALSAEGDLIVVAPGGWVIFGNSRFKVTEGVVQLPTGNNLTGDHVLTIARAETADDERVFDNEARKVADHTPALTLRPKAETFNERVEVPLAEITFAAGTVTALTAGIRRQCTDEITLTRSRPTSSGSEVTIGSEAAARLRPVDAGLEVSLNTAGSLTVAADGLILRTRNGTTPLLVDATTAFVGLGTTTPQARLDVAGPIAVSGAQALSSGGGQLRLNPNGDFAKGVQATGLFAAGSANVGGADNGGDPGAGSLAVSERVRVGKTVAGDSLAALVVDTDTADNTWNSAAFRKRAIGPNWSHIHFGTTGDWYIRSAANAGKVVLQDNNVGRVGVGTNTPRARLEVKGDTIVAGALTVEGALALPGGLSVSKISASAGQVEVSTGLNVTGGGLTVGGNAVIGSLHADFLSSAGISVSGRLTADTDIIAVEGFARADSTAAIGVSGVGTGARSTGVKGVADVGHDAYGVWGMSNEGFAGFFTGKVHVTGALTYPASATLIDHPLRAESYLSHSHVGSPEMLNMYSGIAETGPDGMATVELPDYFSALNRDFTYQLTVLGEAGTVTVAREIAENTFTIKSAEPYTRVSWLVTGVRQDSFAMQNRVSVESIKPAPDKEQDR